MKRLLLIPAAIACLAVPAVHAAPSDLYRENVLYKGTTSKGNDCLGESRLSSAPCLMRVVPGKDRKRLVFSLRQSERCSDGETYRWEFGRYFGKGTHPIQPDGSFRRRIGVRIDLGDGHSKGTLWVKGRFFRTEGGAYRASGTLRSVTTKVSADGSRSTCRSGLVEYTLRPRS